MLAFCRRCGLAPPLVNQTVEGHKEASRFLRGFQTAGFNGAARAA